VTMQLPLVAFHTLSVASDRRTAVFQGDEKFSIRNDIIEKKNCQGHVVELSVYDALAHLIRERTIRVLGKSAPLTYTELMDKVGVAETGKFNYHLEKVAPYLDKKGNLYALNEKGRRLFELLQTNDTILLGKKGEAVRAVMDRKITRVGVALCTCGEKARRIIKIQDLVEDLPQLSNVASTEIFPNLCTPACVQNLAKWCKKNFINVLVIGACSPRLHKVIFADIQESLGIPIENANIMEQCAWVHKNSVSQATEKAKLLIEAAVQVAAVKNYPPMKSVNIRKSVAIIGGGPAGLTVAEYVSRAGFGVYVVECQPTLGGKLIHLSWIQGIGDCASCMVAELTSEAIIGRNTKVFTDTELKNISGRIGDFRLTLEQNPLFVDPEKCTACGECASVCPRNRRGGYRTEHGTKIIHMPLSVAYPMAYRIRPEDIERCRKCRRCESACNLNAIELDAKSRVVEIEVGAIVLTTGAEIYNEEGLARYGYGMSRDVVTSEQFERMIAPEGPTKGRIIKPSDRKVPNRIAIIQCVNNGLCSRFCCNVAKKYTEYIRRKIIDCETILVYDQKRTPDFPVFKGADRVFISPDPQINVRNGRLLLAFEDKEVEVDLVVLNVGFVCSKDLRELHRMIEFAVDDWGFIRQDSLPSGIMACGAVTGPKAYDSLLSESRLVALDVVSLLCKDQLTVTGLKVQADERLCGFCGLCEQTCMFKAISVSRDTIQVDEFKCKGCGACVPLCPTGAIEPVVAQTNREVLLMIDTFSTYKVRPRILAFCCDSCGYAAADNAGIKGLEYAPNPLIIKVACSGRVDSGFVIHALRKGFDGVLIAGCRENSCKYSDGIIKAKRKIEVLRRFFGSEIDKRVRVQSFSAVEGSAFAETVNQFARDLEGLNV